MMAYYVLKESLDERYAVDTIIHNMYAVADFKTTLTMPLGSLFPILEIEITYYNELPDYFYAGQFLLISDKLKKLFETLQLAYEYYPVQIMNLDMSAYYAHLLFECDFVDKSQSVYTIDEDFPAYINQVMRLRVKPDSCFSIAQLSNCFDTRLVVVNQIVADALMANEIKGIELERLS